MGVSASFSWYSGPIGCFAFQAVLVRCLAKMAQKSVVFQEIEPFSVLGILGDEIG